MTHLFSHFPCDAFGQSNAGDTSRLSHCNVHSNPKFLTVPHGIPQNKLGDFCALSTSSFSLDACDRVISDVAENLIAKCIDGQCVGSCSNSFWRYFEFMRQTASAPSASSGMSSRRNNHRTVEQQLVREQKMNCSWWIAVDELELINSWSVGMMIDR